MGTKREIKKQVGYFTSDKVSHPSYKEAIAAQAKIDLATAVEPIDTNIDMEDLEKFLKKNYEVVSEYISKNCAPKKPSKAGLKKDAPSKPAADKKDKAA